VYHALSQYLIIKPDVDEDNRENWEKICRYLLASIESESLKVSYISIALNKDRSLAWIRHIKQILLICCNVIEKLKPETHQDAITLALMLRTLVAFTCPNGWAILRNKQLVPMKAAMQQICNNILGYLIQKGFYLTLRTILVKGTCRTVVNLKPISLNALVTLSFRPLIHANFTENILSQFVCQILSIPALIYQLDQLCPEAMKNFQSRDLFEKCLNLIYDKDNFKFVSSSLQGAKLLALTANLIQLYFMEPIEKIQELAFPQIVMTFKQLFETIPEAVQHKGGTCSQVRKIFSVLFIFRCRNKIFSSSGMNFWDGTMRANQAIQLMKIYQ
jgi:ubiquitin-protein ligase E3 B